MQSLIGFGIRLLEVLFVLGVIGSAMVLVKGVIETRETLLGRPSDTEH